MFIRATRIVDWDLHLSAFRSMIPWFFACDKVNYSRYGSAYWLEMSSIETTHPGYSNMILSGYISNVLANVFLHCKPGPQFETQCGKCP